MTIAIIALTLTVALLAVAMELQARNHAAALERLLARVEASPRLELRAAPATAPAPAAKLFISDEPYDDTRWDDEVAPERMESPA